MIKRQEMILTDIAQKYFHPYNYSKMQKDIKNFKYLPSIQVRISQLQIHLLMINKYSNE